MDLRLKERIDYTKEHWGLSEYYLGGYHLYRTLRVNQTVYILHMEWIPNQYANWTNKEELPAGTASISMDFHTREFLNTNFIKGITCAREGVTFPNKELKEVEEWLQKSMGMNIEKDFVALNSGNNGSIAYTRKFNGMPISPSTIIEVEWNEHGELISFMLNKVKDEQINPEKFTLSLSDIEQIAKNQIVLAMLPKDEGNQLIYKIEETFIRNDLQGIIPLDFEYHTYTIKDINQVLEWTGTKEDTFVKKSIKLREDVSIEQALSNEPHPDSFPITEAEIKGYIKEITAFLQMKYPNDSGKWMVKNIYQENAGIQAELEGIPNTFPKEKIYISLEKQSKKVCNYQDKETIWEDLFEEKFNESYQAKVSKEEAFDLLKTSLKLTPYYAYDATEQKYVLCGRLNCDYFVDAESGEVQRLAQIFFAY